MSRREGQAAHQAYLDAMGIQVWQARAADTGEAVAQAAGGDELPASVSNEVPEPSVARTSSQQASSSPKSSSPESASSSLMQTAVAPATARRLLDWPELQAEVAQCQRCDLSATRTQTVFGVGNQQADWMVIGEAPGADEDLQGEPFVGKAGQLLNQMLQAVGLARQQVYIANIIKCRPPNNRDPHASEAAACESYLYNQIALVKPKVILAVGRVAAQNLLKTDERVGALREREHFIGRSRIPVVVTYHPAYLLRSPQDKRQAWLDLLRARQILQAAV